MTDIPAKYVVPVLLIAALPLGIAVYHLLPAPDQDKATPPQPVEVTLADDDIRNACKAAYSQLLVLGTSVQASDCAEHKFFDRNTGVVAFDVTSPEGTKRMQFAIHRRADGNNWDLFDPKTGKLWSEMLGN